MVPTKSQALIVEPGVRLSFVIDGVCAICLWARHDNEARRNRTGNERDHWIWSGWCYTDGDFLETLNPIGL